MSFNQYSTPQSQFQRQSTGSAQLWMGELDPWWDENTLQSIWNTFGFNNISVKLIREKTNGQSAGYGFIEFPNAELAASALAQNGVKIPNTNKFLKLNWASGGNGSYQNGPGPASNISNRSQDIPIFVGDLAPDVSESALFELFGSKYQSVSSTKIMIDHVTGQSKGYGFVRFHDELDQQRALVEMQGAVLNGRPIRVSTAVPKNRQQQQQNQQFASQRNYSQQSNQYSQQSQQQHQQQPQQQTNLLLSTPQSQQILGSLDSQFQPPLNQYTDPNNTTVFIGGLSALVTEEELRLFFQSFGDITYVKIPLGKGCGFVQYTSRASAELAISKMQGHLIRNSRIRLSWGRSNANPKPQQYIAQPELPLLYGYAQGYPLSTSTASLSSSANISQSNSSSRGSNPSLGSYPQSGFFSNPGYGINTSVLTQTSQINSLKSDTSANEFDNVEQSRLNELFIAARDGRLDAIEAASNGYLLS